MSDYITLHVTGNSLTPFTGEDGENVSLSELSREIKEGTDKARKGEPTNPLMLKLKKLLERGQLDVPLHNNVGWFLYFRIKNSQHSNFVIQKKDLATYLKLQVSKPSLLHSLILHEAVRMKRQKPNAFKFFNCLTLWGLENLRSEDWQLFEGEDTGKSTSLVEKIISCYAKELTQLKIEATSEMADLTDKAMKTFPENGNLLLYKSEICKSLGNKEEALAHLKSLLLRQPSKSLFWRKTAELIGKHDLKIACLCKAISLQEDEEFLGDTRLKLARLLLRKKLPQFALFELQKYHRLYMSKKWALSKEYDELRNRINPEVKAEDDQKIYSHYMPIADDFLNR